MNFIFFSPISFEKWDWRNSVEKGIGGSETSHVEMAWRLARRGHTVTTYAPIPDDCPGEWRGTRWYPLEDVNWDLDGVWILYRCPEKVDMFKDHDKKRKKVWLLWQDWDYPTLTKERNKDIDHHITLCKAHGNYILNKYKFVKRKQLWLTSNGVKADLIEEIEKEEDSDIKRYAFDWGGTIENHEELRQYARDVYAAGHEVYLVPALASGTNFPYEQKLKELNVPYHAIYRVFSLAPHDSSDVANRKRMVLEGIGADYFWDDLEHNVKWARSAGIKSFLVEKDKPAEIPSEPITKVGRNPFRIMHASSPDRGLKQAVSIFKKAKEYVPELELHAFYGFDNLDKMIKGRPNSPIAKNVKELKRLLKTTPGITFHGRVSQPELYREWFKSGMYLYITEFAETSNIASQEAQAMGAVPVFSPIWAQGENIKYGIGVEGLSNDPLTIARAASEIVRLALTPGLQEKIREEMMPWARDRFNWERFTTQWILEAQGKRKEFEEKCDFPEQL